MFLDQPQTFPDTQAQKLLILSTGWSKNISAFNKKKKRPVHFYAPTGNRFWVQYNKMHFAVIFPAFLLNKSPPNTHTVASSQKKANCEFEFPSINPGVKKKRHLLL